MTSLRVIAVLIVLAGFFAGRGMFEVAPMPSANVQPVAQESLTTAVSDVGAPEELIPATGNDEPLVDVYGNEVERAVGDYRVDPQGEIYERHAPDTAVARLGPAEL